MPTLRRSVSILILAPVLLGATMLGSASASQAHQSITLQATLHGSTLHVQGKYFTPGARINLAIIDTRSWRTVFKGTAMTEPAVYRCRKGTSVVCMTRDPDAGDVYFETTLQPQPNPSILALLYRSGHEVGFGRVRAQ